MRKSVKYFIVFFLLLLIILPISAQNSEPEIRINQIQGTAYKKIEQNVFNIFTIDIWRRISENTILIYGDQIRTDADSMISLNLGENINIKLEEESTLELIFDSDQLYRKVKLDKGSVWSDIKTGIDELIRYEVITPSAVAGVHGTKFKVEVRYGRTNLFVEEGEVVLTERTTGSQASFTKDEIGIVENRKINKYRREEANDIDEEDEDKDNQNKNKSDDEPDNELEIDADDEIDENDNNNADNEIDDDNGDDFISEDAKRWET